ncbi:MULTISPECIES: polysaccharide biosynthesis/export family protein [unclassified Rhizobium]|uniref:polysaccharide biosynthesis/export family protein n=1 Tax=unclassified Rhizobium TaxID=2613769 RepID=UPI0007145AAB|nr:MULTISPECIES: polysaccharide biosynthesis/export family protein [unclassified Rhizobium]KQT04776.1 hypothetical protein ASG50_16070 [Rhizobium sp. Leaf386]KQT05142.1 hypothetical protein ASG42_21725 [Rhizobium sp. Leaf391]KQU02128.1 hypothetical protein ASG68_28230 [Rhizobium sp. Leaf453]
MQPRWVFTEQRQATGKYWTFLFRRAALATLICASTYLSPVGMMRSAVAQTYKVSPGDVLMITVYGDVGLSGLFTVSVDGTIGYPILGNMDVSQRTVPDIASTLQSSLSQYIANLSVAVSIKEYAPVYIIGDVRSAGKYEFRPGMIVLELFALSGGLREADEKADASGLELVTARQDYADLTLQMLALDVKRARLEAELKGTDFAYVIPPTQEDNVINNQIVASERTLHELAVAAIETEKRSLLRQKANYAEEIATLEKTTSLRRKELASLEEEAEASTMLANKGLLVRSEMRERQREVSGANRDMLEAGAFLARARQNENETDQRILSLLLTQRNLAAKELREVSVDLARLRKRQAYSLRIISAVSSAAQRAASGELDIAPQFSAVRMIDGKYHENQLAETDLVLASDIVRVTVPKTADVLIGSMH